MYGMNQDPPVKLEYVYRKCMECVKRDESPCEKCGKCGRWFEDSGRLDNKDEYPGV